MASVAIGSASKDADHASPADGTPYAAALARADATDPLAGGLPPAPRRRGPGMALEGASSVRLDWGREARFGPEDGRWLEHLALEGYAVIAGALAPHELAPARSGLWDALEASGTGVGRGDSGTWHDDSWPGAGRQVVGMLLPAATAHAPVSWRVRTSPRVRGAFERIWGTTRLLASFDGAFATRPLLHEGWRTLGPWFHLDQWTNFHGLHSVQGLVSFFDATESTGGLVVVPRSHRRHEEVCRTRGPPDGRPGSINIQSDDPLLHSSPRPRLVTCNAGDLLLWDSRTLHGNTPPPVDDPAVQRLPQLLRAGVYLSMTPAAWASPDVLHARRAVFEEGSSTNHLPHMPLSNAARAPVPWALRAAATAEVLSLVDGRPPPAADARARL